MSHRVAILCEYPTLNGGEQSMLATLSGVQAAGFRSTVLAPPEGPLAVELHQRGVEVVPFCTFSADGTRRDQPSLRAELSMRLKQLGPNLLHANSLAMGRLSGPVAAEMHLPSMAHLRDILKLSRQAIADLNRHGRLLAVSEATRRFHAGQGVAAEKLHVLHNGIDLQQFQPRPSSGYLHRELGLPSAAPLIATIGQLGLRKGQDVLAEAVLRLAEAGTDFHWLLAGERHSDKDESRRFEARLRRLAAGPLAGRMHLLGFRYDIDRLLGELTLLVHPARQEPFGRVLLEAAASGVAVVATDVGGTREIFPPRSGSAILVPPDDPTALAGAVGQLLGDPALHAAIAAATRRQAVTALDIRRALSGLLMHYHELLTG